MNPVVGPTPRSQRGFTLLELVIVTACVGILASIAVPNLVTSRDTANERAVLATLRTIATAQAQVMTSRALDSDQDGLGEALTLPELASQAALRGTGVRLDPTALTTALGLAKASGFVGTKSYLLALYLPDDTGAGILGAPANFGDIDADGAEHSWTCLAWPLVRNSRSTGTFFLNQEGDVLVSRNAPYTGEANPPPPGAGLVGVAATQIVGGRLAANQIGADGYLWNSVQ